MMSIFSLKASCKILLALLLLVHTPQSYAGTAEKSRYRQATRRRKKRKKRRRAHHLQSIFLAGTLVILLLMLVYAPSFTTSNDPDTTRLKPRTNKNANNPRRKPVSPPIINLANAAKTEPTEDQIARFKEKKPFPELEIVSKEPDKKLKSEKLITDDMRARFMNRENETEERTAFNTLRKNIIAKQEASENSEYKKSVLPKNKKSDASGKKGIAKQDHAQETPVDPKFITLNGMKLTLWLQHVNFRNWAHYEDWDKFSTEHYDWWTVPVNFISQQGGGAYAVSVNEFQTLLKDKNYQRLYEENIEYIFQSLDWWDPKKKKLIGNKRWNPSEERIGKILHSLLLANDFVHYRIACYFSIEHDKVRKKKGKGFHKKYYIELKPDHSS